MVCHSIGTACCRMDAGIGVSWDLSFNWDLGNESQTEIKFKQKLDSCFTFHRSQTLPKLNKIDLSSSKANESESLRVNFSLLLGKFRGSFSLNQLNRTLILVIRNRWTLNFSLAIQPIGNQSFFATNRSDNVKLTFLVPFCSFFFLRKNKGTFWKRQIMAVKLRFRF